MNSKTLIDIRYNDIFPKWDDILRLGDSILEINNYDKYLKTGKA